MNGAGKSKQAAEIWRRQQKKRRIEQITGKENEKSERGSEGARGRWDEVRGKAAAY